MNKPVLALTGSVLFVLCISGIETLAVEESALAFTLSCEKDTFLVREAIWVDLQFFNQGDQDLTLDCLDLCWQRLTVHVVNSDGDTLQYCGYVVDGICRAGPTVRPSGTYYFYLNLTDNFGTGAREYLPPPLRYLEEGSYTLQVIHTGVSSNLIRFNVARPVADEKPAHDLMTKASRNAFKYYVDEVPQVVEVFHELIAKYPKSVYADVAHYDIAGLYGLLRHPDKTRQYLADLVLSYPNSYFVLKALPDLLQQMPEDEKLAFLREALEKQPGTRASELAQKVLYELEEEEKPKK